MKRIFKFFAVCVALFLVAICVLPCVATDGSESKSNIIIISYRGDTESFEPNSKNAIRGAKNQGADMVSVSVRKTSDEKLICADEYFLKDLLNGENPSDFTYEELKQIDPDITKLSEILPLVSKDFKLIIDDAWEIRDDVLNLVCSFKKQNFVYLRTAAKRSEIFSWQESNDILVIGEFHANNIFSFLPYVNSFSESKNEYISLKSKNYFNSFFSQTKKALKNAELDAICSTYDLAVSGQREDSFRTFDEMLDRGFCAIETNNVCELCSYRELRDEEYLKLKLYLESLDTDFSSYSSSSQNELSGAIKNANEVLTKKTPSLSLLQNARSALIFANNSKIVSDAHQSKPGAFKVTPLKIFFIVFCAAILILLDVYIFIKIKNEKGESLLRWKKK